MWLILGKNVWIDNAGAHGCKKQHHLRTRGKGEILGGNNITWSLYDSLLIMKIYQDDNIWLVMRKFGKTIASIISYVKNINFLKNASIVANYRIFWDGLYIHQVMLNV